MKDTQHFPITEEEILSRYAIKELDYQTNNWVKVLEFSNTNSGEKFRATLYWHIDDGYGFYIEGDTLEENPDLKDMMNRPEFEYMLDCITEGGE